MADEKKTSGRSDFRRKLLRGLVFGVPGGIAFIYLGVVLVLYFATGEVRPSIALLLAGALFLSALCAAHGMGDWRQALYVVSFLVWGGAFLGTGYVLGPTDTKGLLSWVLAAVPAVGTHYAIKRYLARRQR